MANNFFSADYWKALFFRAMGGQEAANGNDMVAALTGSGFITAELTNGAAAGEGGITDTHDGSPQRAPIVVDLESLRRQWAMEDEARKARQQRDDETVAARKHAIRQALGTDEPVEPAPTREELAERLARLTAILSQPDVKYQPPKNAPKRILNVDFKARAEKKAFAEAQAKAREEAKRVAEQIEQDIRNYDDTIILLLLAA